MKFFVQCPEHPEGVWLWAKESDAKILRCWDTGQGWCRVLREDDTVGIVRRETVPPGTPED
jgi:hypothetical protein